MREDSGKILMGVHQCLDLNIESRSCQDLEGHSTRILAGKRQDYP